MEIPSNRSTHQQHHLTANFPPAAWPAAAQSSSSSSSSPMSAAAMAGGIATAGTSASGHASSSAASAIPAPPAATKAHAKHHHRRQRDRHLLALDSIRHFLKDRSSYDVLPVSFRLIVLDTQLVVGPALEVMFGAGVVSAPLWHSISAPPKSPIIASPTSTSPLTEPASAPPTTTDTSSKSPAEQSSVKPSPPSMKPGFAGMLTVNDIIHLIQYYYQHSSYETAKQQVDSFRLEKLREIEAQLAVPPPPLLSCHPLRPLFEACQLLMKTHARRLPLLDHDEQTGIETVVSVLTQYRVLKFIAMNCRETASLHRSIRSLGIGTYITSYIKGPGSRRPSQQTTAAVSGTAISAQQLLPTPAAPTTTSADTSAVEAPDLPTPTAEDTPRQELKEEEAELHAEASKPPTPSPAPTPAPETTHPPHHPLHTATLDTTVFDVVHMFSEHGISAVPIVDEEGYAVDMYESVDVITLVRTGAYRDLDLTIRQALSRRSADFPGIYSCSPEDSVANIFALLRKRRVHRLLIVESEDGDDKPQSTTSGDGTEAQAQIETPSALEEELEANGPRIRRKGKLVGILALSDLLRHIIGLPSPQSSAAASVAGSSTPPRTAEHTASAGAGTAGSQTHLSSTDVIPPSTLAQTSGVIPEEGLPPVKER